MAFRFIIILMVMFYSSKLILAYHFFSSFEHRRDALDFEDSSNLYYRSKFYLLLDSKNSAGATLVYLPHKEQKQYTANLNLDKDSFAMQLGNYFVQFGSGLMMGKMQMALIDNFSFRSKILKNRPFSPCKSGNPAYSLSGAAFSFKKTFSNNIKIGIHTFYSYKRCFLKSEDIENRYSSSTLSSLQSHYYKKAPYNSAAYIFLWGGMSSLLFNSYFSIHLYGLNNSVRSADDNNISWNYSEKNDQGLAIKKLDNYGIFLFYGDKFLQIFFERAISRKEMENFKNKDSKSDYECGFAYQAGCFFKYPCLKISVIYKKEDINYYAPYANSFFDNNIGEAFYLKVAVFFWEWLSLDNDFSAQKKIEQKKSENNIMVFFKEKYSLTLVPKSSFPVRFAYKVYARGNEQKEKSQYETVIKKFFLKKNCLTLVGAYQKKRDQGISKILNCRLKFYFYKYNSFSLQYLYAIIKEKNPVYVTLNTIPGTGFPGKIFYKTVSFFSLGYSLSYFNKTAAIIYGCEFAGCNLISQNINFFLSIIL